MGKGVGVGGWVGGCVEQQVNDGCMKEPGTVFRCGECLMIHLGGCFP